MKEIKVVYREPNGASVEVTIPLSDAVYSKESCHELKAAVAKNLAEDSTFNAQELAEQELLVNTFPVEKLGMPNPADVFTSAPVAPSTAVAEASTTAQEVTTAITSTPTPNVPSPPAPSNVATQASAVVAPSSPANSVNLDFKGLPWDARINAETRSKIADGSWKLKRGVAKELVEAVQAELKHLMAIPQVHSPAHTMHSPETIVPAPPSNVAPPPPQVSQTTVTFPELLVAITSRNAAGTLTNEQVIAACNQVGVPNLPLLAQREDLTQAVANLLGITKP